MSAQLAPQINDLAIQVMAGLSAGEKTLPPGLFYDPLGLTLFEAISLLPEYGPAAAIHRLIDRHASEIANRTHPIAEIISLAPTDHYAAAKLAAVLDVPLQQSPQTRFRSTLFDAENAPLIHSARIALRNRNPHSPVLLAVISGAPGESFGSLEPNVRHHVLKQLHDEMQPGDSLLFYAEFVNEVGKMLAALDDKAGVFSAFNKNILNRLNRELFGHFDPATFTHRVRWNAFLRRLEMDLVCAADASVYLNELGERFHFQHGEAIRTANFYRFQETELTQIAQAAGFYEIASWTDNQWSSAAVLWQA